MAASGGKIRTGCGNAGLFSIYRIFGLLRGRLGQLVRIVESGQRSRIEDWLAVGEVAGRPAVVQRARRVLVDFEECVPSGSMLTTEARRTSCSWQ
jgi:hypothetical protein